MAAFTELRNNRKLGLIEKKKAVPKLELRHIKFSRKTQQSKNGLSSRTKKKTNSLQLKQKSQIHKFKILNDEDFREKDIEKLKETVSNLDRMNEKQWKSPIILSSLKKQWSEAESLVRWEQGIENSHRPS